MTTTTTDNPLGVPAHRHPNGGGWVADTAHVELTAYIDNRRPDAWDKIREMAGNGDRFGELTKYMDGLLGDFGKEFNAQPGAARKAS